MLKINIISKQSFTKKAILKKNIVNGNKKRNFLTVIPQYKKDIKLAGGKFVSELEPGIHFNIDGYHDIFLVDMRDTIKHLKPISVISMDGISFEVGAAVQYRITDAKAAVMNVKNNSSCIGDRCKMELRNKIGAMPINLVIRDKETISNDVIQAMKPMEKNWGISISTIQINDIILDDLAKKTISITNVANLNAQAKIIDAKSDVEIANQNVLAADIYANDPIALKLKELQTWNTISKNGGNLSFYVVPFDLDALNGIKSQIMNK